jgi:F-type H+-transporting ATPase subunit b
MDIIPNITLFYQFLNLLILLIFLNFLLFKPILGALTKRENAIQSLSERVEKAKKDAKDFEREYDEVTQEKKRPIIESKDAALSEANTGATKIIEKARHELTEELSKIKDEIEREGKKVHDTLKADVDKLSGEVAEKILRRSLQ